jgi:hypothetical protein
MELEAFGCWLRNNRGWKPWLSLGLLHGRTVLLIRTTHYEEGKRKSRFIISIYFSCFTYTTREEEYGKAYLEWKRFGGMCKSLSLTRQSVSPARFEPVIRTQIDDRALATFGDCSIDGIDERLADTVG